MLGTLRWRRISWSDPRRSVYKRAAPGSRRRSAVVRVREGCRPVAVARDGVAAAAARVTGGVGDSDGDDEDREEQFGDPGVGRMILRGVTMVLTLSAGSGLSGLVPCGLSRGAVS